MMSYFGSGRPFSQTVILQEPPEIVQQRLFMATRGLPGVTPIQTGPWSILVSRRFIPTWAIVCAVIGFFCFLLGLLFLLVWSTDTLEIRTSPAPDGMGSTVSVSGVADSETITRLQGVFMAGRPVGWGGPRRVGRHSWPIPQHLA